MPTATKRRCKRPNDLISASEVASFSYCTEQWRLQHGLGLPVQNQRIIDAGNRHHRRKEAAERLASGLGGAGLMLAAFGLMALLWLILGKG